MQHQPYMKGYYWQLYRFGLLSAMLVHFSFILLFLYLDVNILAIGNVASVFLYLICYRLLLLNLYTPVMILSSLEIILHSVAATLFLGWESGFQFYLMMFIPIIFLAGRRSIWIKMTMLALCFCIFSGLYIASHMIPAFAPATKDQEYLIYLGNMAVCFSFLALVAHIYVKLVRDSGKKLEMLASTDALTQLHNRRKIRELIEYEHHQNLREQTVYSVMLIDIDNFKPLNDQYGHNTGDYILKSISKLFKETIRKKDSASRWGGEEFLFLCPNTDRHEARLIAERVRNKVNDHVFKYKELDLKTSISIGIAESEQGEEIDKIIYRADAALYEAKEKGKNQVRVSQPEEI